MYNWDRSTILPPNDNMMGGNGMMQQTSRYPMSLSNIEQRQNPVGVNQNQVYYIPGRGVNSPDEVKPFEVPMDSPLSVFPNNNRKQIYVKYWDGNGGIVTDTYNLVEEDKPSDQNPPVPVYLEEVHDRLVRIEELLLSGNKPTNRNYKPYYNKNKSKGGCKNDQNSNSSGQSNNQQN